MYAYGSSNDARHQGVPRKSEMTGPFNTDDTIINNNFTFEI